MKALKSLEIRRIDSETCKIKKSIDLMEDAGRMMAEVIRKNYEISSALVILGSGGNAGDGLVCARHLISMGFKVDVYIISSIKNNDAKINLEKFKGNIVNEIDYTKYQIIIDAILGNNQHDILKEEYINLINDLNKEENIKVVSLDMPTGINCDNGLKLGAFVHADLVICVEYPKLGLFLNDGLSSYKKIETIKIGLIEPIEYYNVLEDKDFSNILSKRERNTNKNSFGKGSIVAGSINYPGASLISYNAIISFMMGVGYQRLYVPEELYNLYALRYPELIVEKLKSHNGCVKYNKEELDLLIEKSDAISIGMGMMVSKDLYKILDYLIHNYKKILIIDADALNTISKYGCDIFNNSLAKIILTPHPKEFSRLSGISVSDILNNPIDIAKAFALKYNLVVLLKGTSTIITSKDETFISTFGNHSLAKGGSGDALSGILCGIMASEKVYDVMHISLGSYILGKSSELAIKDESARTLTISKIINYIPKVIKLIEGES